MNVTSAQSTGKSVNVYIDTSGIMGRDSRCVVAAVCVEQDQRSLLGTQLQLLRDQFGCNTPLRFSDLSGDRSAATLTANAWLNALLRSEVFAATAMVYSFDASTFSLSHYGDNCDIAVNKWTLANVRSLLTRVKSKTVNLQVCVDGPERGFNPNNGLISYLRRELPASSFRSSYQPRLLEFGVQGIPKKPLAPVGPERHEQDLVALADICAGAFRRAYAPIRDWNGKAKVAKFAAEHYVKHVRKCDGQTRTSVVEVSPPRTFKDVTSFPILLSSTRDARKTKKVRGLLKGLEQKN